MTRDQTEFEEFYRTYYRKLLATLRAVGATSAEAEDSAQTAFAMAFRGWEQITNPKAWLRVVAMREFVSTRRRCREGALREVLAVGTSSEADTAVDRDLETCEDEEWVKQMLYSLPPTQRDVMALIFDEHRPAEIAEILNKTDTNVRQLLRHARVRLLRALEGDALGEAGRREVAPVALPETRHERLVKKRPALQWSTEAK